MKIRHNDKEYPITWNDKFAHALYDDTIMVGFSGTPWEIQNTITHIADDLASYMGEPIRYIERYDTESLIGIAVSFNKAYGKFTNAVFDMMNIITETSNKDKAEVNIETVVHNHFSLGAVYKNYTLQTHCGVDNYFSTLKIVCDSEHEGYIIDMLKEIGATIIASKSSRFAYKSYNINFNSTVAGWNSILPYLRALTLYKKYGVRISEIVLGVYRPVWDGQFADSRYILDEREIAIIEEQKEMIKTVEDFMEKWREL